MTKEIVRYWRRLRLYFSTLCILDNCFFFFFLVISYNEFFVLFSHSS
jgi:hypothetical protein